MTTPKPKATKGRAEVILTVRVPSATVDRLDALAETLSNSEAADLDALLSRVSRGAVVRLAIAEGLRVLDRRHGRAKP